MTYDGWWRQLDCVGGGGGGGAVREPDGGLPAHLGQLRVLVRGGALLQPRTLRWLDCLDIDSLLKMESWWQSNDKVSYIIKSSPSCSLLINQKLLRIKRWKIFLPTNKIISKSHSPFTKVLWTYFLSLKNWQITINDLVVFIHLLRPGLVSNTASIVTLVSEDMRKQTFNQLLAILASIDILWVEFLRVCLTNWRKFLIL